MKKHLFILLAAMLAGGAASAQVIYHYQPATAPWTGDNLFSLHVGSFYQPSKLAPDATDIRERLPLSFSFRYDGEMAMGTKWVAGFQAELNYAITGLVYNLDGDQQPSQANDPNRGKWLRFETKEWTLAVEERFMVGYYLTENLSLYIAPGLYESFLTSRNSTLTRTDKVTGTVTREESPMRKPSFGMHAGFSGTVGAYYYFTDNFFATATAKVHIPIRFFDEDKNLTSNYGLMIGVGYKFIR